MNCAHSGSPWGGGLTDVLTDVLKDVDHEEGRYQVVDALHVAASRVADGPDEKDPFKYLNKRNGVNTIGRSLNAVGGGGHQSL